MGERTLQRYKLLEEVGQGGMAVVYKGLDTTLNREVAVKVLHPHLAGVAESRARLQREAHAVAKLRHENILEIFDYSGPDSPESFIVTEFIHGKTLKNFLAEHPLPFPEVAEMVASEVARALEHAHALGVIHRDIKPENVMIRDDGLIKLMDFGIAQIVDKERMTVTGQLLGSPAYMAPEHVEGKPLDFRTDVFAVGILLYQLATGKLPFHGKNPHEVLKRIAECRFSAPELVNARIGARLARVITKALSRDPNQRFPDVAPMRKELMEDLADAGVEDPRAELAKFFADPKGWTAEFKPRLVRALAERGRVLEGRGRKAAALEMWSRALSVDPHSAELKALVEGMARRRTLGRAVALGAGVVLLGSGIAFGVRALRARPVVLPPVKPATRLEPRPAAAVLPPAPKPATPAPPPAMVPAAPPRPAAAPKPHTARPPEAAPLATRKIRLNAFPPGDLKVALDDGAPEDYNPAKEWALDGRSHTFHFFSPYAIKQSVPVTATQSGELGVTLQWKMARLVVKTTPDGADVVVEDRPPVRAGQPIDMAIEGHDGTREVTVRISAPGCAPETLKVQLVAGRTITKSVELKKQDVE